MSCCHGFRSELSRLTVRRYGGFPDPLTRRRHRRDKAERCLRGDRVLRVVPAAARVLPAHRARETARVPRRHVLGEAGAGVRRSARATAHRRPGAGRARREPHGPRVHRRRRRRLGRLPDGGACAMRASPTSPRRSTSTTGSTLRDAFIAAAVRCAPPDNKPTPEEIARCLPHLERELAALPRVSVVVALGKIAFDAYLQLLKRGRRRVETPARVRSRRRTSPAERTDAVRLLSPEPAEHEHRQAHGGHAGRCLSRGPQGPRGPIGPRGPRPEVQGSRVRNIRTRVGSNFLHGGWPCDESHRSS